MLWTHLSSWTNISYFCSALNF
uniref:Uncharacterized protein n=1 Tax=Anguilla anguilla TaxID=7936 RepID=A0A0E9V241_ANGAN